MSIERTFSILKPDAVAKNVIGKITSRFEKAGLRVIASRMERLTVERAKGFYSEHEGRAFFDNLVTYMSSGPVILQVLEGEGAIELNRELMGATNPAEAAEGTLRKLYAKSIEENAVHGSDSKASAEREISYFFEAHEISPRF